MGVRPAKADHVTFSDFAQRMSVALPGGSGATAIMVGAGFSRALNPDAPGWAALINRLRQELSRLKKPIGRGADLMIEAYRLSRRHSHDRRTALPTEFQNKVLEVLRPYRVRGTSDPVILGNKSALAESLRSIIDALRCRIIIDLNYDDSIEEVLKEAGRRYVRWVGSEASWAGTPPLDAIRLWKIHGTIDQPATVVLSPTEYQRLYEVNEIGDELGKLGKQLSSVWTFGVGLQEDDVWLHLCRGDQPAHIVALWLTDKAARRDLGPWEKLVAKRNRKVTVLSSSFASSNGRPALAERMEDLAREIVSRAPRRGQNEVRRGRIDDFEKAYADALANEHDTAPIVKKYRYDFNTLREHFLSYTADGFGPRWCPSIERTTPTNLDPRTLETFARDFIEVVRAADEACTDHPNSIIVSAAAQSAAVHVIELATLLGIDTAVELDWKRIDLKRDKDGRPQLRIGSGGRFLVGCNPFSSRGSDGNPMHLATIREDIRLAPPLIDDFDSGKLPPDASVLLTEDEWEACVVFLYWMASPGIRLGTLRYEPRAIPPLYPCGFRLLDLRELRAHNLNGVSKYWHLVDGFHEDGRQICKGGGLRDRHSAAFEIGSRGALRIGEYDEFLAPAFRFK